MLFRGVVRQAPNASAHFGKETVTVDLYFWDEGLPAEFWALQLVGTDSGAVLPSGVDAGWAVEAHLGGVPTTDAIMGPSAGVVPALVAVLLTGTVALRWVTVCETPPDPGCTVC